MSLSLGKLTALCTLAAVALILFFSGQQMFSPGPLSARSRGNAAGDGVRSHAKLSGNCSACHAAPWSGETMADRCLDCHADVRDQIGGQRSLHGRLANALQCLGCHTEHKGTHASLTNLATFDHDCAAFKLTGKHRTADCSSCHTGNVYKGTPQTCAACHAEPDVHKGRYGTNCLHCHSTETWKGTLFTHSFPLNHGHGKRNSSACATCHAAANDFRTYTCYGCHRHDPVKTEEKHVKKGMADIRNCVLCHPTGRKHRRAGP